MAHHKERGGCIAWLRAHVGYDGDNCLIWPFSTHPTGYGSFGHLGKMTYAHRFMCEQARGAPPSPKHHAAHSCGNGHLSCVNPNHLFWKTPSENNYDKRLQGRVGKNRGAVTHLTDAQIKDIRISKETVFALMKKHNLTRGMVRYWRDTIHKPNPQSMSPQRVRARQRKMITQPTTITKEKSDANRS